MLEVIADEDAMQVPFAHLRVFGKVPETAPFFIARKDGSALAVFLHLSNDFCHSEDVFSRTAMCGSEHAKNDVFPCFLHRNPFSAAFVLTRIPQNLYWLYALNG